MMRRSSGELHLRQIVTLLKRRRGFIFTSMIVGAALAAAAAALLPPRYTAKAQILREAELRDGVEAADDAAVDTLVELLLSPNHLRRLAASLAETPAGTGAAPDFETLSKNLNVFKERRSRLIGITYVSTDPAVAAEVANRAVRLHLDNVANREAALRAKTLEALKASLDAAREELVRSEDALRAHRIAFGVSDAARRDDAARQIAELNAQLRISRSKLAEAEARLDRSARRAAAGSPAEPPEGLRLSAMTDAAGPIAPTPAQLQREAGRLTQDVAVHRARIEEIESRLATLRSASESAGAAETRLRELEREARAAGQLYENLLRRTAELRSSPPARAPVRIVTKASPPERPSSPSPVLFIFPALLASGLLSGLGAVVLERLDERLRSERDAQEELGAPCIGLVPRLRLRRKMPAGAILPGGPLRSLHRSDPGNRRRRRTARPTGRTTRRPPLHGQRRGRRRHDHRHLLRALRRKAAPKGIAHGSRFPPPVRDARAARRRRPGLRPSRRFVRRLPDRPGAGPRDRRHARAALEGGSARASQQAGIPRPDDAAQGSLRLHRHRLRSRREGHRDTSAFARGRSRDLRGEMGRHRGVRRTRRTQEPARRQAGRERSGLGRDHAGQHAPASATAVRRLGGGARARRRRARMTERTDRAGEDLAALDAKLADEDPPSMKRRAAESRALRVLIVTEDDPLYVIEFFRVFFPKVDQRRLDILGITIDRAFHEPLPRTLLRMLRFYGFRDTFRLGLRYLLARARNDTIEALAAARGVPVLDTPSVNDPGFLGRVRSLSPDVVMSVAGPEIFSPALLATARLGCVNVHSGRLPRYRGMMPTFWQLERGEKAATVTVHRMVEKLDAGEVLGSAEFPLRERDSLDRVILGTKRLAAILFLDVLEDLRAGRAKGRPLDMTEAGYFSFPGPEDVRRFRKRGHRLL